MKNRTKETIEIYLKAIWKYKWQVILILISVIGAGITNSQIPILYKSFFNTLNKSQEKTNLYQVLFFIILNIGCISFLKWIFWRIVNLSNIYVESRAMADLSNKCFAYLHKHSYAYFNNSFTGSMVKKVRSFITSFEAITDLFIFNIFSSAVNITAIIIVLLGVNKLLALGIIIWILAFLFINWIFIKYKLKFDIKKAKTETEITGILSDTITNSNNIKLFNGYKMELENFKRANEKLREMRSFIWKANQFFESGQGFFMILLEFGIFYLAINLWKKNIITVGDFVLIQAYLLNIFNYTWDFGRIIRKIYENFADANEMTEIFQTKHEVRDIRKAKELEISKGKINFKDIRFKYSDGKILLKDFDLIIKPKEKVALIGPSGSGKTTIVKLLLRMYNVTSGKILIDGKNIAKVTQESLRKNISLVPQDPILFHRTLIENIKYGKPEATDKEAIEASKMAHAHEFIVNLEDGYKTFVGERGIKLSGGERQRVAIARAILRNAPILVLDEATSSLDSESETLIQNALDNLMKNKTVIVIAHRLSTIRKADRIIVLEKGKIIEQGTHTELNKKEDGLYKKLWNLQVCGFIN